MSWDLNVDKLLICGMITIIAFVDALLEKRNLNYPPLFSLGPYQNGSDVKLQPGNYSFPFEFRLPPNGLPTSFEGPYGSIRYWIHGEADRPWRTNWQFDSPLFIVERVQIRDLALLVCE